jgi:hypothetical protein
VNAKELEAAWRKKPFQPFKIYLKDGREFTVRNPRTSIVLDWAVTIGIATPEQEKEIVPICEEFEFLTTNQIERLELLDEPAPFPQR